MLLPRYYLWKCVTDDGCLFLLVLLVALATGVLATAILRLILVLKPAAMIGGVLALVFTPFSWWYLASLANGKTGRPVPGEFAFVEEMKSSTVTCAYAAENTLVIRIRFCGVSDTSMQDRMLAALGKKNTYSGPKPVVVTFSPSPQVKEVVHPDGSKSQWSRIGKDLREELLPAPLQ